MNIGENIKKFRTDKGMTQKELADKIDRSLRMVQKYESGEVEPSIEVLNEIANILGTDFISFINIPNAHLTIGKDSESIRLEKHLIFDSNLVKDLISSLLISGDLTKSFLIGDDLDTLTESIKNYIMNQVNIITDKNFMIIDAVNDPDSFNKNYLND